MDCVLNSTSLPIITEMGHISGDCYCYLCTCGTHQCPSTSSYKRRSLNQFKSMYKTAYLPKRPTSLIKYIRTGELLHSKQKMDFATTQRSTYQKSEKMLQNCEVPRSQTRSPMKFTTNSTYRANFPDWQSYKRREPKTPEKFRENTTKFSAVSTYKHDFAKFQNVNNIVKSTAKCTPGLIVAKEFPTGLTTNQMEYRYFKVEPIRHKRPNLSEGEVLAKGTTTMQSTYNHYFLPNILNKQLLTKKQVMKLKRH